MSFVRNSILLSPFRLASSFMTATGMEPSEDDLSKVIALSPSPASTEEATDVSHGCLVDFVNTDYRGFLFVVHENHGLMLLHCTRKKAKGPHFQLPGGHVDDNEFIAAAVESDDRKTQLLTASMNGAVRELYEETGIDVRGQLDRVTPVSLYETSPGDVVLDNEFKDRLFFLVNVTDKDFANEGVAPMGTAGSHLKLKLSVEHSGYTFEPEPKEAAKKIEPHSGGKCSQALLMAMGRDSIPSSPANRPSPRRSKYSREINDDLPVELMPPPRRSKNMFCCLSFGDNDDDDDL